MANQCMSRKANPLQVPLVRTRAERATTAASADQTTAAQPQLSEKPFSTHLLCLVSPETRLVRQHSVQELKSQISLASLFLTTVKNAVETDESIAFIPVLDLVRLDDSVTFRRPEDARIALTPAKARLMLEEYIMLKQDEINRYESPLNIAYNALIAAGKQAAQDSAP